MNRPSNTGPRERVRDHYEERASSYDRVIRLPEALLFADGRRWACEQAQGEVLELAAGTGRNLPYYRDAVRLTAIELSPAMLGVARGRAERLGRPADLRVGDAEALDFPDERFDTVVATLALCSIPDDRRAVAESPTGPAAWRPARSARARAQPGRCRTRGPAAARPALHPFRV